MKILYIITQADGGGAQKYTLALAKHFGGAIAAGSEAGKLFDDAKKAGIETFPLSHLKRAINPWHDFLAVWEMRQLIKIYQPDVIHLNSTKVGILGSFAAVGMNAKVVFTAHGFRFNEPLGHLSKNFYLSLEKVASSYRDYIICVSEADHKAALDNNLIAPAKISTIHNGIAPINFLSREEARKELGLPLDKKIYGTIANDYLTKGLDVLERIKPISGSLIAVIGQVSNQKQSNEHIKYLGYKPNASKYLKAFNGTFVPSRKEGFPYAVLEAMQAGQPIVATEVGGIPEALGDAGILVQPDSPEDFDRAIETELSDEKKIKELSQKALERSKLFTEDKMLEETKKIYEKILLKL